MVAMTKRVFVTISWSCINRLGALLVVLDDSELSLNETACRRFATEMWNWLTPTMVRDLRPAYLAIW
jgi:hypothetical protein